MKNLGTKPLTMLNGTQIKYRGTVETHIIDKFLMNQFSSML